MSDVTLHLRDVKHNSPHWHDDWRQRLIQLIWPFSINTPKYVIISPPEHCVVDVNNRVSSNRRIENNIGQLGRNIDRSLVSRWYGYRRKISQFPCLHCLSLIDCPATFLASFCIKFPVKYRSEFRSIFRYKFCSEFCYGIIGCAFGLNWYNFWNSVKFRFDGPVSYRVLVFLPISIQFCLFLCDLFLNFRS